MPPEFVLSSAVAAWWLPGVYRVVLPELRSALDLLNLEVDGPLFVEYLPQDD